MKRSLIAALVFVACGAASASAQYRVPQQTSYAMSVAERANLQLAHDFWRDIVLGGNLDIASHYMPADFISRNPNVAAGRDAFVKALRERPSLFQNTSQRAGTPEVEFAKNDYVFFMWASFVIDPKEPAKIKDVWVTPPTLELISGNFYLKFDQRTEKDPTDPAKMAVFYRFDMVRADDGLIQEHWDVAFPNGIQPR